MPDGTTHPTTYDLALSFYRDQSAGRASSVNLRDLPIADVIRASKTHADEDPHLQFLARSMKWQPCLHDEPDDDAEGTIDLSDGAMRREHSTWSV